MITIDCQTCPVRGRLCGDCFVPVLGRGWVSQPQPLVPIEDLFTGCPGLPLDVAERDAVAIFVRQGMVTADEARDLWAQPESGLLPGSLSGSVSQVG